MAQRLCIIEGCGNPVPPGRKTCSIAHSALWRKLSTGARLDGPFRSCTICGTQFIPHGPQTECCKAHHRAAVSRRREERRKEPA